MITSLEDFKAYNLAMEVGEEVWDIVTRWGYFEKDTVGRQFVKAVDSIAANLSEGLADIIIAKQKILPIIPEVRFLKPRHGWQNP